MSEMEIKRIEDRIEYLSFACFLLSALFLLGQMDFWREIPEKFFSAVILASLISGGMGLICGIITLLYIRKYPIKIGKIYTFLGLCFLLWGLFPLLYVPGFIPARGQGRLTACESNLKNIGTALEIYANDNKGTYPIQLNALVPNCLKHIPKCPAAEEDTYSLSYRRKFSPPFFEVFCFGDHHKKIGIPPNYPRYNSEKGLIVKPEGP